MVGHTHVHGVLERHLAQFQLGAGWGLEETERASLEKRLALVDVF